MKCGEYTLNKGTKVLITSVIWNGPMDKSKLLGKGTYIGYDRVHAWGQTFNTPKFRLGRKIIRGYECWWIPASVAQRSTKSKE